MFRRTLLTRGLLDALLPAAGPPTVFTKRQVVPHGVDTVFGVVRDVARYQDYLPYVKGSVVTRRLSDDVFEARLDVGFAMYSESYTSRVTATPAGASSPPADADAAAADAAVDAPARICSEAVDSGVFDTLRSTWEFRPVEGGKEEGGEGGGATEVSFTLAYSVSNPVLRVPIGAAFPEAAEMQVAALEARCRTLAARRERGEAARTAAAQVAEREGEECAAAAAAAAAVSSTGGGAFEEAVALFQAARSVAARAGLSEEEVAKAIALSGTAATPSK
eukprot:Rhum_TRINITY_DN13633_c7_g1::Rhum_TRINITY_DN13633_c7_g1_i1::g.62401::m.62401/K18588/COQ10; coenzyme Q-binding protein COQ10